MLINQQEQEEELLWKKKTSAKWELSEPGIGEQIFPERNSTRFRNHSPVDLFELFFDDKIILLLVTQSNMYSLSKNWSDPKITADEMKVFLGILIVSGYSSLPSKAMYWSSGDDMRNLAVYQAMRRDRFDTIMKCLHFHPNSQLDMQDKYTKLRPLTIDLQKKFMLHLIPTKCISHDEAMVEYFGKHSCKQAIRNKPIRFGYKMWCQNTPSGYLISFDPYQGKTYKGNEETEKQFGKCASTVLHLLDQYSHEKKLSYHLFFDNLFTSLPLLEELKKRGYNGTGTLRSNRVGNECPLLNVQSFGKKERGYIQSATATMNNNKLIVTRWNDNAVVTVASTSYGQHPVGSASRWSRSDRKTITLPIPNSIEQYNKNMGGTDRMDQNINAYRIGIRGKKWWWSLFTWLVDASIQNAWQLSRIQNADMCQINFRRDIAMSYLKRFRSLPQTPGRKAAKSAGETDLRYDEKNHLVQPIPEGKKRRCVGITCNSIMRTECAKCNVGLCIKCFASYHTK